MKSLILNGAFKDDHRMDIIIDVFSSSLKQKRWDVEVVDLNNKTIAGCLSCDACWYKTPGVCAIDDDGRTVAAKMIQSDLTIFVSPVMFGGYSSELKKFIDRTKPILSPLMKAKGSVLGHAQRYHKYPKIISVGQLPAPDQESEKLFTDLLYRNSLNYTSPAIATGVVYAGQDKEKVSSLASELLSKVGIQ
jgi:multimeric flavodoxin WrbA